jgi:hypothetical protein
VTERSDPIRFFSPAAVARRSVRVSAAAAKGGGVGSARGRLVARNAVAVTCWHSIHLPSLFVISVVRSRLLAA